MHKERLLYLLNGWRAQKLSSDENLELNNFLNEEENRQHFIAYLSDVFDTDETLPSFDERLLPYLEKTLAIDRLQPISKSRHALQVLGSVWFRYAAVLLFAVGLASFGWYFRSFKNFEEGKLQAHDSILPAYSSAILTLADGSLIDLDSVAYGMIAYQQGAEVKLSKGLLDYEVTDQSLSEAGYNTITTLRGRQFQVHLPDGTKAWLNAASSIKYPTTFRGNERRVYITGEVYFEVSKNAKKPFFVQLPEHSEVRVIGTSFNINAYENEPTIKTTLVEGSVKISTSSINEPPTSLLLKPGQQAKLINNFLTLDTTASNVAKSLSWKNGIFHFEDVGLEQIMRELERWYDIDVVYKKGIPDVRFVGEVTRGVTLKDLLNELEGPNIKFKIEGRKVMVTF
jgi:transmembrane sensor